MPWQKHKGIGISLTNRFGMADVNRAVVAGVVPYKNFGYGMKLTHYGNNAYSEQSIGLSVAHAFNEKLAIGCGADYQSIAIAGYGHRGVVMAEISLSAKVSEQLLMACRVYNPTRAKFSDYSDERLATIWQMGLQYKVNAQVKTVVEVEKSNAFAANIKGGVDYTPAKDVHLRMGFSTLQPQFTFGFGFKYKQCQFEAASAIHQTLGVSSNLSVLFEVGH